MEKRLFIAFALSFLVLALWGVLNPRSRPSQNGLEQLQYVEDKEDTFISRKSVERQPKATRKEEPREIPGSIEILENDKLIAEFSNIGGTLIKVTIKEHDVSLPVTNIVTLSEYVTSEFVLGEITSSSISYSLNKNGMNATKQYSLSEDDYLIHSIIEIQNTGEMSKNNDITIGGFSLDISRLDNKIKKSRDKSLLEYSIATNDEVYRKANAFKFSKKDYKEKKGTVNWIGFRDRYFCAIFKPQFQTNGLKVSSGSEAELTIDISAPGPQRAGEIATYESVIYVGPQRLEILKNYEIGFEDIMKFSNWGPLDAVAKVIYRLMNFMHKIIPNWGVCIILISLIIYGAMYPLTMKGMMSMKRMQSLQPKITKLREQYKSNPQKLNKEIMAMYKEHKINPLGGCFPLLLQMPVFIGLYQVLWRSVSFKGAGFLWIKDLSEPDRLLIFPFTLPVIGNELNILPIIMVVVMAFQQKLSSKNMAVTDPSQIAQQKMMMTIFPLFLGFIFYKFASGLSLYFTIFYLMSTFTQWKMSKVTMVVK